MATRAFDTLTGPMPDRTSRTDLPTFLLGDTVRLARAHPCGGDTWLVDRLGADLGLRCLGCGRHVLLARTTVERRLTGFVSRGDAALSAAAYPIAPDGTR
jgi:hypothetical protein